MLIPSDINAITEQPAVATEAATETSVPTAAPQQATGTAMEALPQAAQGVPHSVREATPSAQPSQDSQGATQATQQQWLAMPKAAPRQVLLLVENLHELEHHWQVRTCVCVYVCVCVRGSAVTCTHARGDAHMGT